MIQAKFLALGIGGFTGAAYWLLQSASGSGYDSGIKVIGEGLAATVVATAVSYPLLKERIGTLREDLTRHIAENNTRFKEIQTTLNETATILRELTGDVGELVGTTRSRTDRNKTD